MPKNTVPAAGEAMPPKPVASPPPVETMKNRLLEITDKSFEVSKLIFSVEMATAGITNSHERSCLCQLAAVVGDHMNDLIELINLAREQAA